MTLKELKKYFQVVKGLSNYGGYSLYNLTGYGLRSTRMYVCSVIKKNNSFAVVGRNYYRDIDKLPGGKEIGKYRSTIGKLQLDIGEHMETLKYHQEYYTPSYREGTFENFVVLDYMRSLGFKNEGLGDSYEFVLDVKNIYDGNSMKCNVTIDGLDSMLNPLPENVKIKYHNGDWSWLSVSTKRTATDIIKGIDSLLKPLFTTDALDSIKLTDKMNSEEFMGELTKLNPNSFETLTVDYKDKLRSKLAGIIMALDGENRIDAAVNDPSIEYGFQVLATVDYLVPIGNTQLTPEKLSEEWFGTYSLDHSHAFRDNCRIGNSWDVKHIQHVTKSKLDE